MPLGVETRVWRRDHQEACEQWSSTVIYFTLPSSTTVTQFVTEIAHQPQITQPSLEGRVQATAQPAPVTQIPDGQVQAVSPEAPVEQIEHGLVKPPAGAPAQQIADGQAQLPGEDSPTLPAYGSPVQQIPDGQVQLPAAPLSPQAPNSSESSSVEAGPANSEGEEGSSQENHQQEPQKGNEMKDMIIQSQLSEFTTASADLISNPTTPGPIISIVTTTISSSGRPIEQTTSISSSIKSTESEIPSSSGK